MLRYPRIQDKDTEWKWCLQHCLPPTEGQLSYSGTDRSHPVVQYTQWHQPDP